MGIDDIQLNDEPGHLILQGSLGDETFPSLGKRVKSKSDLENGPFNTHVDFAFPNPLRG